MGNLSFGQVSPPSALDMLDPWLGATCLGLGALAALAARLALPQSDRPSPRGDDKPGARLGPASRQRLRLRLRRPLVCVSVFGTRDVSVALARHFFFSIWLMSAPPNPRVDRRDATAQHPAMDHTGAARCGGEHDTRHLRRIQLSFQLSADCLRRFGQSKWPNCELMPKLLFQIMTCIFYAVRNVKISSNFHYFFIAVSFQFAISCQKNSIHKDRQIISAFLKLDIGSMAILPLNYITE